MRRRRSSAALALALMGLAPAASAQSGPAPRADHCRSATELRAQDLHGLWQLVLWTGGGSERAPASTGAMLFGPHPEYPDSVRGRLRRSGPGADLEAEVAGDVGDDGEFNLDESADGVAMDAVWNGQPSDCGRTIRGLRRPAEGRPDAGPALQFLLQRAPAGH
ncbi:hypothetical protein [Hydrogenophaga pseudoflava]|uniref:hypothetical protein n=1 Tax=Hydrogenophaga pseudoflava TaxID=47421 RepID=UPI0027E57128|nr:hypothetical protein [Hydrogenophaga pseudoflava]MDQ7743818.1 hypothetical protein [Hydrogenophaga pseudoflava]